VLIRSRSNLKEPLSPNRTLAGGRVPDLTIGLNFLPFVSKIGPSLYSVVILRQRSMGSMKARLKLLSPGVC
jgi:hypothetical protein